MSLMQRSNEMEKEIVAELGHITLLHDYIGSRRDVLKKQNVGNV